MNLDLKANIQRLFLFTIVLKTVSSFIGWLIGGELANWILGFVLPLFFMGGYIALGMRRDKRDLTDEKFADSCYYLGFIFTIVSIIFCLLDIPKINTALDTIAVRFGAAMFSTVVGIIVRVYLINFKKEFADAVQQSEDAIVDAAQKFISQIELVSEKSEQFQAYLSHATELSVERAHQKLESGLTYGLEKLENSIKQNSDLTTSALHKNISEINNAVKKFCDVFNELLTESNRSLAQIQLDLNDFSKSLIENIEQSKLPVNFFSAQLQTPLDELKVSISRINSETVKLAHELSLIPRNLAEDITASALPKDFFSAQLQPPLDELKAKIGQINSSSEVLAQKMASSADSLAELIKNLNTESSTQIDIQDEAKTRWRIFGR
jgi:hypothetical protein